MRISISMTLMIIGMITCNQIVAGDAQENVQTLPPVGRQPGTVTTPPAAANAPQTVVPATTPPSNTVQPITKEAEQKTAAEKAAATQPAQETPAPSAPVSQQQPAAPTKAAQAFGPIPKEAEEAKKEQTTSPAQKAEAEHKKAEEKKVEAQKTVVIPPPHVMQPVKPAPMAVPVKKAATPSVKPEPAAKPSAPLPEEEQPVGIDTVNVESASGNWLLKRIWFERAQENYEKIKALFDRVLELRVALFTKRAELERTLFEPFYVHSGIGQGELLEVLARLLQEVEEFRRESGAFTEEEHELFNNIEREKATLDQLQKDVTTVTEIDNALEAAVLKLIEQVNVSRSYEKQAWEAFKEIGHQLSDKKARDLYYTMDTYRKNIADIIAYIQGDFGKHVMDLERTAKTQIDRVTATLKDLKQKGIDFKEQAHRLEQRRLAREKAQHTEQEEEEELGYWDSFWSYISNGFSSIYEWIWPSAEEEEEEAQAPAQPSKAASKTAK